MNKTFQKKLLKTTLLLTLLTITSILATTTPAAHAAPQLSIEENSLSILNDVIGVETELYTTSQTPPKESQYLGLPQKETDLYLTSGQEKIKVHYSYVNNQLHEIYLSDVQGQIALKQPVNNTVESAKNFLLAFKSITQDALYSQLSASVTRSR